MFFFGFTDMFIPHLFTNCFDIQMKSTTRDYPFDTSILHWGVQMPLQDRKFHELLLALDPSLKDWDIPQMFGNPPMFGNGPYDVETNCG